MTTAKILRLKSKVWDRKSKFWVTRPKLCEKSKFWDKCWSFGFWTQNSDLIYTNKKRTNSNVTQTPTWKSVWSVCYFDDVMSSFVRSCSSQLQSRCMFSSFITFNCNGLKTQHNSQIKKVQHCSQDSERSTHSFSHPGVVEGDPVLHSASKPLETKVGKVVEVVDHGDVLPAAMFLLQHLRRKQSQKSGFGFISEHEYGN